VADDGQRRSTQGILLLDRFRKMPKPVRVVYARPRTFIAIAIGIVAFFLLPGSLRLVTRLLIGWDIFVALYLVLAYIMMFRSGLAHIRRNAVLQDDGRFLILLVTALGAFASIAAIVFELGAAPQRAGTDAGDRDDRAVMGGGAHHLRAALRPRILPRRQARRIAVSERRPARGRRLLGLRVFLVRDRHDRAGLRRRHHRQDHPPHRDRARHHLVRVQHRAVALMVNIAASAI
jgi:hypothetical protein